jgi:hypothetical protein
MIHRRAPLAVLLPLLLAPAGLAEEPAPAVAPAPAMGEEPERNPDTRRGRRLLFLTGGSVLRGACELGEEGWRIRLDGAWHTIPAEQVLRAELEREVLREASKRRRALGRAPSPAEVSEHGAWLYTRGLHTEFLELMDALLGDAPDEPRAIELLAGVPPLSPMPPLSGTDLEPYLTASSRLGPAGREQALAALAAWADTPARASALDAALERDLHAKDARRRVLAAHALRRLRPGEAMQPALADLLGRSVLDPDARVRTAAGLALRAADDPGLVQPLANTLGSSSMRVRIRAAEALATAGYASAVPPLVSRMLAADPASWRPPAGTIFVGNQLAYVQDFDVEVAAGAAIAKPRVATLSSGSALQARVLASRIDRTTRASERATFRRSLERLTGEDPGSSTGAWRRWWEEHEEAWVARARREAGVTEEPGRPATGDA